MASASPPEFAPWSLVAPHLGRAFPFLLDRGRDRPSFAGSEPSAQLVVEHDGRVHECRDGRWRTCDVDPIEAIERFVATSASAPWSVVRSADAAIEARAKAERDDAAALVAAAGLPRTVGYLAYELGAFTEPAAAAAMKATRDVLGTPLALLSTYDRVDAWEPRRAATLRATVAPQPRCRVAARDAAPHSRDWKPTPRGAYDRGFAVLRRAIEAGDIYQANLSRRIVADLADEAAALYARIRRVQPVAHGAFLDCGGFQLLSNSPETFLARDGNRLLTRPIKGTRPRSSDRDEDAALRRQLLADPKERAEHLMIVDLERNDLGRIARTGSVRVERFAEAESYATVHHLVSDVCCELRGEVGLAAILRATFPGGSITGAPKIRAMELLAQVEGDRRGPYCGAIGFFDGCGRFELSIAIRTALTCGGRVLYSAGGGIVADSDPLREWNETEVKAAAFFAGLAGGRAADAAAGDLPDDTTAMEALG